MAENGTPPAPAEEVKESGRAAAPERGVQLDVDKMIESLLSYENNPGKQVWMCCVSARRCSCNVVCFRVHSVELTEYAEHRQGL